MTFWDENGSAMKAEVKEDGFSGLAAAISLRPVVPDDDELLYEIYAGTRADELAQVPWSEEQLKTFLKMQLGARDQSYRMHYTEIDDQIILFEDQPVGRLIVIRTEEEIRLADVALLPKHRSKGVGAVLIKDLMTEADRAQLPIRLQVEKPNVAARRLYDRMGFATTGENITHFQMEYQPGTSDEKK
jgi:GNAT superfamily N-acetyltransferase